MLMIRHLWLYSGIITYEWMNEFILKKHDNIIRHLQISVNELKIMFFSGMTASPGAVPLTRAAMPFVWVVLETCGSQQQDNSNVCVYYFYF